MADAYWDQTVLLLHCEGTNASTQFQDATYRNTVTAFGDAQISTAQKMFGASSALFDGTGDYLTIQSSTNFDFGSGDMTIEFWFKSLQSTSNATLLCREWGSLPHTGGFSIQLNGDSSSALAIYWADYSTGTPFLQASTTAYRDGNWHHFAWTKSSTTHRMFIDGVVVASATTSTSFSAVTKNLTIGNDLTFGPRYYDGLIDELRITKGVARYTANFTAPTAAFDEGTLTAADSSPLYWDQTIFLADMEGVNASTYFKDYRHSLLTPVSGAKLSTAQAKFGSSSAVFNGSTDAVTGTLSAQLGAGDFTVEYWVNHNSFYNYIAHIATTRGSTGFSVGTQASAQIVWYSSGAEKVRGTTAMKAGVWYHVAFVRSGGVIKGYLNGVPEGTSSTDTSNFSDVVLSIGRNSGAIGEYFNGYLDSVRITAGVARYTDRFVPPTTSFPVQAQYDPYWGNVVFSPVCDGANASVIFSDLKGHTVSPSGNVQFATDAAKFNSSAIKFDGAGDYLDVAGSLSDFAFGTGDFTVELFANRSAVAASVSMFSIRQNTTSVLDIYTSSANSVRVVIGGTMPIDAGNLGSTGTWYHVALVRASGVLKLYINGTSVGSSANSTNIGTPTGVRIGSNLNGNGGDFNGYIDNLRVTKGVARYTGANFTLPTEPYGILVPQNLTGTVKDSAGNYVQRTVRSYRRSDGKLIGTAVSDPLTGVFSLPAEDTTEHFVVAFDPSDGVNAVIYDHIVPVP